MIEVVAFVGAQHAPVVSRRQSIEERHHVRAARVLSSQSGGIESMLDEGHRITPAIPGLRVEGQPAVAVRMHIEIGPHPRDRPVLGGRHQDSEELASAYLLTAEAADDFDDRPIDGSLDDLGQLPCDVDFQT